MFERRVFVSPLFARIIRMRSSTRKRTSARPIAESGVSSTRPSHWMAEHSLFFWLRLRPGSVRCADGRAHFRTHRHAHIGADCCTDGITYN